MPVWLVAVKLGMADGSDGTMKGARQIMSKADRDAMDEAKDEAKGGKQGKIRKAMGRMDPRNLKPRTHDPGRIYRGDDAR